MTAIKVGDLVSGEGHVVCGHCRNCRAGRRHLCINTSSVGVNRDGAFAEFVVIPATNVWRHPDGIDPDLAAIFDPLGNAVHTTLSFPMVGEDVLHLTGAGPIGLMAAKVARHIGARFVVITDVNEERLALARLAWASTSRSTSANERVVSAQRTPGHDGGLRHRLGDERPTRPRSRKMLENMTHGGRIAMLGLPSAPDLDRLVEGGSAT